MRNQSCQETIKAYKFRSSTQLPFVFDIIFNQRLYCADWGKLNDPMEGFFSYSYSSSSEKDYSKKVEEIIKQKKRIKICSLSKTFDCHLLWAHYASGFDGLAIEIELCTDKKIKEVEYRGIFSQVSIEDNNHPTEIAETILSSKYDEWKYEKELRILNNSEWYSLKSPVTKIIIGHRMNPALVKALRIICKNKNIILMKSVITDDGIIDLPIESAERIHK